MERIATFSECYQALRYNDVGYFTAVMFGFIMWMRGTPVVEE